MIPGVTLYEPVFTGESASQLINNLGISALEMSPHERLLSSASAQKLLESLSVPPMLTLHLPYHHEPSWAADCFDPSELSTSESLIRWLEGVAALAETQDAPIPLTLHGAKTQEHVTATYRMLDWFTNTIEKRHLSLRPSLENLYVKTQQPFGSTEQIEKALRTFSPLLGWTWDLTHDHRRTGRFRDPGPYLLTSLTHVHLHGFDDQADHLFIGTGTPFYEPYLALLEERKITLPLILEVLVEANYPEQMLMDLKSLRFRHEKPGDGS